MRIASLSPAVTEILFKVGMENSIVCVDRASDYPEQVTGIEHINDIHLLTGLLSKYKPEIVFLSGLSQAPLAQSLRYVDTFAVIHQSPLTLTDIYESIRQIGTLLDCEERARALAESMRSDIQAIKRRSGMFFCRPKVFIYSPAIPLEECGWVGELVRLAGGTPFIPSGKRMLDVTVDDIAAFDPDVIVICSDGRSSKRDTPDISSLRAAQMRHVFSIDQRLLLRPGPRLIDGAQRLYGWVFQAAHQ